MRVLFVVNAWPTPDRPFYGTFTNSKWRALKRAGVEMGVLYVRGHEGPAAYAAGVRRALAANRWERPDVVHAHYGFMGLVGRLIQGPPLVITFTGGDLHGNPDEAGEVTPSRKVKVALSKAAALAADATITKAAVLEPLLPASVRPRNHVIPDGVDVKRFGHLSRAEARARLGWDPDRPTAIFVADPKRKVKNFPLAEAAVEHARRTRPELDLRVAGSVPAAEIPLWMAAADVLLLTSQAEGAPNVIREAMAAELPAVSTPVGDVEELFAGVPGCYVRPHEPEPIGDALLDALAHGRTREAREAMERVSVEVTAQKVIGVYEAVASGRLRRGLRP